MSILKLFGIAVICAVVCAVVKSMKPEISVQVSITCAAVFLIYALADFLNIKTTIENALNDIGMNASYIEIVFKALGIAYLVQFAADICRDTGETALAGKVELCGKVLIISLSLPCILSVLELVSGFAKSKL